MSNSQPIGVFDSGVGGLSVVGQMLKQLPDESIVYFGDTARVPYGSRQPEEIVGFGDQILSFLLRFDVKLVVAACGTSCSVSLPLLRNRYHLPILGVLEPGVRAALKATRNRRVGILATAATVNSGSFPRCFQAYGQGVAVFTQACPRFVPLVEAGMIEGLEIRDAARQYLQPLLSAGVDTIVLGCTHYPFLAPVIRELAGKSVSVVDPADETVKELAALLASLPNAGSEKAAGKNGQGCNDSAGAGGTGRVLPECPPEAGSSLKREQPEHRFFASGSTDSFYSSGRQFLGDFPFLVEHVDLNETGSTYNTGGH